MDFFDTFTLNFELQRSKSVQGEPHLRIFPLLKQTRNLNWFPVRKKKSRLDGGNDIAEDFSDGRTQCRKDYNDDDGNKNKNKSIFNQTLTFASKHFVFLLS